MKPQVIQTALQALYTDPKHKKICKRREEFEAFQKKSSLADIALEPGEVSWFLQQNGRICKSSFFEANPP